MPELVATPLHRLLRLRQFAPLASVELGELAVVAENLVETQLAPHMVVAQAGQRITSLHLVITGQIEAGGETWGPRQVYGALEVLAKRPPVDTAIATVETRTFQLAAGDAREILEDNFGLLRGVLRELAGRLADLGSHELVTTAPIVTTGKLSFVERMIALRQHVPFVGGRLQALAALAQSLEECWWTEGERIVQEGAATDSIIMVRSGTALREPAIVLGPGDTIGALEALARRCHAADVVARSPVFGLRCSGAAILDVLEDHTDLALAMIETFAGKLLDRMQALRAGT